MLMTDLIATWVPKLGRAVALSVLVFFLTGFGWGLLVDLLFNQYRWLQTCAMSLSPVFGPVNSISILEMYWQQSRMAIWISVGIVILTKATVTGVLLWLTIKTFDRSMGRISESRMPRRVGKSTAPVELVPTVT